MKEKELWNSINVLWLNLPTWIIYQRVYNWLNKDLLPSLLQHVYFQSNSVRWDFSARLHHPAAVLEGSLTNRYLKNQLFANNKFYRTSKAFCLLLNLGAAGAITKANKREEIPLLGTAPPTICNYLNTRLFTAALLITAK